MTAGATLTARSYPDDYLGLPGDNLNLYAVMNLFQESQTLEEFERKLNDPDLRVNNLDLDGDNYVDYITVHDYVDGNVHNIVLRVALNRYETQDVAVFIVKRFSDGSVNIQLVGDEALYGRNYIIEPDYDNYYSGRYNPGYTGGRRVTIHLVADWPVVRFIYLSSYIPWHSTWYWGYYPSYWSSWRPYYYHYYYGFHYYNIHNHYCVMFRRWDRIRYYGYNDFYYSRIRSHSTMYSRREKEGRYRDTYSRPDMRRMGESHYASLSQTRRGDYRASSSDATRRSSSTQRSNAVQSNTTRRPVSDQGQSTVRRSASSTTNRQATTSAQTARRPATTQRPATVQRPATTQRPVTSQRQATT